MAVVIRRIPAVVGIVVGALALLLPASPASAQTGGPGAQATPVVGISGTANCPTNVGANQVTYAGPAGPFTILQSVGSCTSYSANSQGNFTVGGSGPGSFSSSCQTSGLQSDSAVTVPAGTVVNGVLVTQPTVVDAPNTPVIFPGGIAATLNVRTVSGSTVTQTAIVSGGTQIGRVICGAANVYPLPVETAGGASPAPALPLTSSGDDGGVSTTLVLLAGALALAVAAQLTIGRKMWRRQGDAAG